MEELLTTQCDRFSQEEVSVGGAREKWRDGGGESKEPVGDAILQSAQIKNMWAAFPPDVGGNVDYKNICYVITHGDAKDQE